MGVRENRLVESVLFSASQPISISEIVEATGFSRKKVKAAVDALIQLYNEDRKKETSLSVVRAGDKYTMQVKQQFVEKSAMVSRPEIQSHLLKTLSLIAYHQPIKQSDLRRMIGPKVYDHVDELADMRLISTRPHGSTEMLKTTRLFPEYFGIDSTDPDKIRSFLSQKVQDAK